MGKPLLIVLSGPSGVGKTTLSRMLLGDRKDFRRSVSCTTRSPRGQERDGVDYRFLGEEEFARRVREGEFLEHAVVHGFRYGTLRRTVEEALAAGHSVVLTIDVQGASQIREAVGRAAPGEILKRSLVDIFVTPPTMEALRQRLARRAEDTTERVQERLANAADEMRRAGDFRHVVVNDVLEEAYAKLRAILDGEQAQHG